MKLLLVDDEKLTRQGILANIDWQALQIDEVLEAADGAQALALAQEAKPAIVLTDIRMPHMDGITFAKALRKVLPDTHIIFMSGYSDKEYLHAAIKLKAISYVEKPIDNAELTDAISEAVSLHEINEHHRLSQYIQHQENSSKLALSLTRPLGAEREAVLSLIKELDLPIDEQTKLATILIKIISPNGNFNNLTPGAGSVLSAADEAAKSAGLGLLSALRHDGIVVLTLFSADSALAEPQISAFLSASTLKFNPDLIWFAAAGTVVSDIDNCYESYNHAAVLMQQSFFADSNTILKEAQLSIADSQSIESAQAAFCEEISHRSIDKASQCAADLLDGLKSQSFLLPSNVKDLYFRLFIALEQAYQVELMATEEESASIWDRILACETLQSLHNLLMEEITRLNLLAVTASEESAPVTFMRDYVHKNFANAALSVKDISDSAKLSVTYACTVFKNETGKTMNQYLTEYRLERAKQLLLDPRVKISDISARVGYTDGGYFGKSFKKATGLSPSEYREKVLN